MIERLKETVRLKKKCFFSSLLIVFIAVLLSACSGSPLYPSVTTSAESSASRIAAASCVSATEQKLLAEARAQHGQKQYTGALAQYEAILAQQDDTLSDAYALLGVIALRLDRENPMYDRHSAQAAVHVLERRIEPEGQPVAGESGLVLSVARLLVEADITKDQVVLENDRLRDELAQHEEALKRLRELTLGR